MGESFLGLPNRFYIVGKRNQDTNASIAKELESEMTYNPNRALSAYYGYRLSTEYVNRSGGLDYAMKGALYTYHLIPQNNIGPCMIGSHDDKYKCVFAENFIGVADEAKSLHHVIKLNVTGGMTGYTTFKGDEATIELNLKTNHDHNGAYLPLSGGTMTGSIKFLKTNTGIMNANGYPIFWTYDGNVVSIGEGPHIRGVGTTRIYSRNDMELHTNSVKIQSFSYNKGGNVGVGSGDVYLYNNKSNKYLQLGDDGVLRYQNQPIYHTGNFNPANYIPTSASCNKNWNWSGKGGQPTWVWGGEDGTNMYVYNPLNWKVRKSVYLESGLSGLETGKFSGAKNVYHQYAVVLTSSGNFRPDYCWEWYDTSCANGAAYGADGINGLGTSTYRWKQLYASKSSISTSDRNLKDNIKPLTDQHIQFFLLLQPVSFTLKYPGSDRTHIGFIAQDVEEAMKQVGLSDLDFAGFCKDVKMKIVTDENGIESEEPVLDENGNLTYIYSLRYEEFIAILAHALKQVFTDLKSTNEEITKIKDYIGMVY